MNKSSRQSGPSSFQNKQKKKTSKSAGKKKEGSRSERRVRLLLREPRNHDQVGTVVRPSFVRAGMSDIRSHRIAWVAGYTYVGNGTDGTANSVYFKTVSGTWLIQGFGSGSSGQVPILASDADVGASYIKDVEKHYARKVIKRMWIHIASLQPSTSNNMMAVFGFSRGASAAAASIPITFATAAVTANSVANLTSMKGSVPLGSWESRSFEITEFIAGGSGGRQNEFDISASPGAGFYLSSGTETTVDPDLLVPSCFAVAGNSTTSGLEGTTVHQITFEQEVDLLDYVGGMAAVYAED